MTLARLGEKLHSYTHFCVGSLPFDQVAEALTCISDRPWIVPFWPELPRANQAERSLSRSLRATNIDWAGYAEEEAAGLYLLREQFRSAKVIPPVLKCQLLGPLSLWRFAENLSGSEPEKFRVCLDATLKQLEWQCAFLQELGIPLLFVLDEPALGEWHDLDHQITERLREAYTYLFVRCIESNNYLGLHCCARFDHELFDLPFDLFSFDVISSADSQRLLEVVASRASTLVERGVVLAPGVIPAVVGTAFEPVLQRGKATLDKWHQSLGGSLKLLFSANCGFAYASTAWVEAALAPIESFRSFEKAA